MNAALPTIPVTVIMPAYNHARFVVDSINSVLNQDFRDFEFLIGDDGSRDGTPDAIRTVTDDRIQFFDFGVNRGAVAVLNDLIRRARGRYLAVINSDDQWTPGKLGRQVAFLESNGDVGACFGRARFFDGDGNPVLKEDVAFGSAFDHANRSRGAWFRQLFTHGNGLCHPSVLMRTKICRDVGEYDDRLLQLPDYDFWLRVITRCQIHVFEEELVNFRVLPGENASDPSRTNHIRTMNEHFFIARKVLDRADPGLLKEAFGLALPMLFDVSERHTDIARCLLLLESDAPALKEMYKVVGLERLHGYLGDPAYRDALRDFGLDVRSLHRYAATAGVFRPDLMYVPPPPPPPPDATKLSGQVLARELSRRLRGRLTRSQR